MVSFEALSEHDQEALSEILEHYLIELEKGVAQDLEQLIAQHPRFERELRTYHRSIDFLHAAANDLKSGKGSKGGNPHACQQLGDFRINCEIGRGGMGIVFKATQVSLDRHVALKVLPFSSVLHDRRITRFQNEAQVVAKLQHPNIVPIYSVDCDNGVHYYTMQYIDGVSLDHVIDQLLDWSNNPKTSLPDKEFDKKTVAATILKTEQSVETNSHISSFSKLMIQAARALDHAHSIGVVHRDVKPSNLILDREGQLWVTDFGLARFKSNSEITMTGDIVGTMRYLSPEAAAGHNHLVDHLTDVYSLGVTFYELLTLRHPHAESDETTLLESIRSVEPPSLRKLNPVIPSELEAIVLKAMAKSREQRYDSAGAFADDLQSFIDGEPTLARRPSVFRLAKDLAQLSVVLPYLLCILLVVVVAMAAMTKRYQSNQVPQQVGGLAQKTMMGLRPLAKASSVESQLNAVMRSIMEAVRSGKATRGLESKCDLLFDTWIDRIAPAARHSSGWAIENDRDRLQQKIEQTQLIYSHQDELLGLLTEKTRDAPHADTFLNGLAKLIADEIAGLPIKDSNELDSIYASINTPAEFARSLALTHLVIAKHQISSRDFQVARIQEVVIQMRQLQEKDLANEGRELDLGYARQYFDSRYLERGLTFEKELTVRAQIESILETRPSLRRYLIVRQTARIVNERNELAVKNKAADQIVDSLHECKMLVKHLEKEYFRRCGDTKDRSLPQMLQRCELLQDKARNYQESNDKLSLTVGTYTIENRLIAADHLRWASELLVAIDLDKLASKVRTVRGNLLGAGK